MNDFKAPVVSDPNTLAKALANSQVAETPVGGTGFLKINHKNGEWSLGRDLEDVTDELIIVDTQTIKHGWFLWHAQRVSKLLVAFHQPLPLPMDPIGNDFPTEGRSFDAWMANNGDLARFDTSSHGGKKGTDILLGAIKLHASIGSRYLFPKVKLGSESYLDKTYSNAMVYNPSFSIVAWCNEAGEEEPETPQIEDKSATKVTTKRKRRTKAQIEADNTKAEAEAEAEEIVTGGEEEPGPTAPTGSATKLPRRHRRENRQAAE